MDDEEIDKELEAALSAFGEEKGEGGYEAEPEQVDDNQDEQDQDEEVEVAPAEPGQEPEPADAGEQDWFTPEQFASMPKGSAIPMSRFQQIVEQRNREREEAKQLRERIAALESQPKAPEWMQQPPPWYQPPQSQKPQGNGLPEWLNPDDMDPAAYNAFAWQHQQQMQMRQQLEQYQQQQAQFAEWQRQQQIQEQARRIEAWASEVTRELPDVDQDFLYTQLRAGLTMEQAHHVAVGWQNKINGFKGAARPQAPAPAPQPARSASGAPAKGTTASGKKFDRTTEEGRKALLDSLDL